jgi:multidrug efflux pump subunit AcrA (membrane-fusion protein)
MNRLLRIVALGVVAGGLSACGSAKDRAQTKAAAPVPVTVSPVATIDTAERLEAGGVVAARESASISSRIVATISGIRVKSGDRVRAGDVLITLDARDATEHTGQARASAVAAEKTLAQARTERSAAEQRIRPRITNVTRLRPVFQRRRRGSRALRRASRALMRILRRRGPPLGSPRRPNPSGPFGHRSTAS